MARHELRQARYAYLKSLGFSPAEARRLRDRSADNIDATVARREQHLASVPQRRRTVDQRQQLRAIRTGRRVERREPAIGRGMRESRVVRQRNFDRWSGVNKFPSDIRRYISKINRDKQLQPLDSYGYRMFYHRYVNQFSEPEARQIVESSQS